MLKKTAKTITETDLYRPLHDYLISQGYTVRSEVKSCDVAAVKGEELVIVEMKRVLNLALVAQAVDRQKTTDSVYVAIPRPSNRNKWMAQTRDIQRVLRRLELGLILVSTVRSKTPVEIIFHPSKFQRRRVKAARRSIIEEIEQRSKDFNEGGSTRKKIITAYRENAIQIACHLSEHGPMTTRQLRALGTGHKTQSILHRNVYGWFDRVALGTYRLNARGEAEMSQFQHIVDHCRSLIAAETTPDI